jgi:hypothetical protein
VLLASMSAELAYCLYGQLRGPGQLFFGRFRERTLFGSLTATMLAAGSQSAPTALVRSIPTDRRERRQALSAIDENRYLGMGKNLYGLAAQKDRRNAAPAVRCHQD